MLELQTQRQLVNLLVKLICLTVSACTTLLLLAIAAFMVAESLPVWSALGPLKIIAGTDWSPLAAPPRLGIGTMILSTLWVALGAVLLSAPLGFAGAIFLAEFAPPWLAGIIRPVLNILTGIPSVVYGFVGAAVLIKFFEVSFNMASGESLFCASLILTVMVLPYIVTNSESALRSVPREYRQAALALGVSKQYLTLRVLLPLAKKGLTGALVLAFGRAAGETMAVLMLAGNTMLLPTSWFSKGEPLSALIALELGTSVVGSAHYQALFAAGLVLLILVICINLFLTLLKRG
uniref:phosphate ABC transporter permease subunit PstC n=1 Tax=Desulforadius tongensis TaxID=1216062 RepID=UPI001956DF8E|nr:phosphate ABC transporter permease subunit PstC [Desulforadius tongensis]